MAATATAEVTAAPAAETTTSSLPDGARPGCRGALPTRETTLAIPTHLAAMADALEGLRLSRAVRAWAVAGTKLAVLLAELVAAGSPYIRPVAWSRLPTFLCTVPVTSLPLG
jgi:hypothetical protein